MKIILNPKNGATIKDIWHDHVLYLNSKEGDIFEPGQVMKFEDKSGDFLLETYGFLQEIEPDKVKQVLAENSEKKYRCDFEGCTFASDTQIALFGHKRKHKEVKDQIIDEVDIPMARGVGIERKPIQGDFDRQKDIDSQATSDGLIGEGLRVESL